MDHEGKHENRRGDRRRALNGAQIIASSTSTFDCIIKSRNEFGIGLKMGSSLGVPDHFKLVEGKTGEIFNCRVVWRKRTMLGVELLDEAGEPLARQDTD